MSYLDLIQDEIKQASDFVINEVYFGKNKYLIENEQIIGEIRTRYKKKQYDVNRAPEWLKFSENMEKAFKLECFSIDVLYTPAINASTTPLSFVIDAPNKNIIRANEIGFNFESIKGASIISYITQGLLFSDKFTNEEIMGIMIHEIGHNFQQSINPLCDISGYIKRSMILLSLPLEALFMWSNDPNSFKKLTKSGRRWYSDILKEYRKTGEDKRGYNDFIMLRSALNIIYQACGPFITFAELYLIMKALGPMWFTIIFGMVCSVGNAGEFKSETIADNFATAYGYGPALTSGLAKITDESNKWAEDEELIKNHPFYLALLNMIMIPTLLLVSILDCHPDMAYRCNDQIEMLERELDKSNHSPKMKRKIKAEIKEIRKSLNHITDTSKDKTFIFSKHYSAFMLAVFGGDHRAILGRSNHKDFDKIYDECLEKARIRQEQS